MKYIATAILLFTVSFASAQIVNIPDPFFKQVLVDPINNIDINGDGEIQVTEALSLTNLTLSFGTDLITDFTGIKAFSNLLTIEMTWGNNASSFDVSNMTNLAGLRLQSNWALTSLNVSGCVNLQGLSIFGSANGNLNLIMGPLPRLKGLGLASVSLNNLDLRIYDSLAFLNLEDANVGNLNISGLTKIENLNNFGHFGNLFASGCTALKTIKSNNLTSGIGTLMDVTNCISLTEIYSNESNIEVLDLSTCINMEKLEMTHNSKLKFLNIKNGSVLNRLYIDGYGVPSNNPTNTLNICTDDFETNAVINIFNVQQYVTRPINVSSYCSFFPGGTYNTISGKVKLDLNNNGCSIGDAGMGNVPIRITELSGGSVIRYTAPTGDYAHYPYAGNFTLTPYFPYPYFNIAPGSANVIFNTASSLADTVNFCIAPTGVYNDLEISFLPTWPPARPGMEAGYQLLYKNRGTTTLSGNVQLNFDNSKMNFGSASTPVSTQNAGQLIWNYSNLLPFQTKTINVSFILLPPPVNNIGDTLIYLATVNPAVGDYTPYDNSFILPQRILASFDPNDKQCLDGSKIEITSIDKFLHYIIRFQNLGTDTAFNVVIADQLSDKMDWNSVEIIGSSHTCDISQKNGKLEFYFQNIKLPYKAINEPASNGFVAFKIKPKNTVIVGDSLNNKAAIYFDFNAPVNTNMATSVIIPVSPIPVNLEYFNGKSNPTGNLLEWKALSSYGTTSFSIERSADGLHFSSIGNIIASYERCQLPFDFTDHSRLTGENYYRLKIIDADGKYFYSKVLVIANSKSGFEFITITNNEKNVVLHFNAKKQQNIQMRLIASDGSLVNVESRTIPAGNSKLDLQLMQLSYGIYAVVIHTDDGETITKRFFK